MLLSVIVPCFNGQSFISDLIDSIARHNQDLLGEFELLLIDDESNDNTFQLIKQKALEYPFIQAIGKKHGGIADTRNFGLSIAKGAYVTFCDQDDICVQGWSTFVRALFESQADLLISNYAAVKDGATYFRSRIEADCICERPMIKEMVKRCLGITSVFGGKGYEHIPRFYPTIWNCIFKKSILTNNQIVISSLFDYEDDWKLLTDMLLASNRVLLKKEGWYQYIVRKDSESHRSKHYVNYWEGRKSIRDYYLKCMSAISTSNEEKQGVLAYFDKETLLTGFVNYRYSPNYLKEMKEAPTTIYEIGHMITLANSRHEGILVVLLSLRLWWIARLLSKR